ncbi:alpha-amylase family glycosyl hydrolase [Desulfolucanica intricata]|uniref:alpha-amylase family glycosyl hydrolase n=1 Tax=Desulfolucanica intricata TaxID=1285191 RepID=UPI00082EFDA8|nr:alpha-amylase family glycosyl hydrolase [Desulfolucanica intricata]
MSTLNLVKEPLSQNDIIYFILTDRFMDGDVSNNTNLHAPVDKDNPYCYHGGDFKGIKERIPYLVHLGITALWITPVYLSIGSFYTPEGRMDGYHGYWVMDFERVDPHLISGENGKKQLKDLVDCLHKHNIKVILDIVVNHTGYHTEVYRQYRQRKIPYDWFYTKEELDALPEGSRIRHPLFGLPHLNHSKVDARDYFVNNIVDWIEEIDIDALRMDAIPHIDNEFWYYFKSYVRGKYRNVFFLGEDFNYDEESLAVYQRYHDFDSLFDFPLFSNIIDVLIRNEDTKPPEHRRGMMAIAGPRFGEMAHIEGVLDADRKYNNANRLVTMVDNHDTEKRLMNWALQYRGGDYLAAADLVKYVLTFQFTTRGIPQIYYGTELGMTGDTANGGDVELRKDMPWEKIDPRTNEPLPSCTYEREIYKHLQKLIKIRKENQALCFGYLFTLYSDYNIYAYLREFRGNTVIVVMNNGLEPMQSFLKVPIASNSNVPSRIKNNLQQRRVLVNLINPEERCMYLEDGTIEVKLRGKESKVYRLVDWKNYSIKQAGS